MDMRRLKNDRDDDNEDITEKKTPAKARMCLPPVFENPSNTADR